jgi:hypothetical protein
MHDDYEFVTLAEVHELVKTAFEAANDYPAEDDEEIYDWVGSEEGWEALEAVGLAPLVEAALDASEATLH